MASSKPPISKTPAQRLPAPSLFVGPPSRNASSTSLLPPPGPATPMRAPLPRQRSYLRNENLAGPQGTANDAPAGAPSHPGGNLTLPPATPFGRRQPAAQPQGMGADHKSQERTDAIWTEMQNTLKEVELNAASGSHVFSSRHARALDELRAAQISLAQAWAKTEADESATRGEEIETLKHTATHERGPDSPTHGEHHHNKHHHQHHDEKHRRGSGGSVKSVSSVAERNLEQETENDMKHARRRREANDRYFQRVNAGVLDVVAKLEEVAKAMKGVEVESREIWGDQASDADSMGISNPGG